MYPVFFLSTRPGREVREVETGGKGRGLCDGLGVSFFYNLASPLVEAIYPMSLVSIAGHHLGECWTWFNSVPHFCDLAKWNACTLPSLFGVKKQICCVLLHVLFLVTVQSLFQFGTLY